MHRAIQWVRYVARLQPMQTDHLSPRARGFFPRVKHATLLSLLVTTPILLPGCGGSGTSSASSKSVGFVQTNLVADTAGKASVTDPNLINPWGISYSPTGAFWVSDNGTGLSTLYNGSGAIQKLVVTIPAAGGGQNGPVSGQVYNSTSGFTIPGQGAALFIFDNEDGVVSAWNGSTGANAVTVSDQSGSGAVYKGLAMAQNGGSNFLYATNFSAGTVDVYDTNFNLVSHFTDSNVPSGFAPFGIADLNGLLYVTFAKQDAAKHDDVAGPGNGYVDVFNPNGTLVQRLVSQGALNSPWGLAIAPTGFGGFGGDLLVGNFGDGKINVYNASSGQSVGQLQGTNGQPIVIPGLWGLIFGNNGSGGSPGTLYFTSGPSQESHGLLGSLSPGSG